MGGILGQMGALSIINSGSCTTACAGIGIHCARVATSAGRLWGTTTITPHPTPSQVITLLALFIMQPHPFMHRRGNPCQTAKQHSNKTAFCCSPQFQPLWPRRNGRRGGQRTSKVKREGSCGVTGMVMTTRVHRDATFVPHFRSCNATPSPNITMRTIIG